MSALAQAIGLIVYLVVACFAVYLVLELRLVWLAGRKAKSGLAGPPADNGPPAEGSPLVDGFEPNVAVLLPIRDESVMLECLVESMARLEYPRDRLEILLLDDSSEETESERSRALV